MSTPTRKMRDVIQSRTTTEPTPISRLRMISHAGRGSGAAASRNGITNGVSGGIMLVTTARVDVGLLLIGMYRINGIIYTTMTGVIRAWASLSSETALPIAAITVAIVKYAITK